MIFIYFFVLCLLNWTHKHNNSCCSSQGKLILCLGGQARLINRIKSCSCSSEQHKQHIPQVETAPHGSFGEDIPWQPKCPGLINPWGGQDWSWAALNWLSQPGKAQLYLHQGRINPLCAQIWVSSIITDKFFIKGGILIIQWITGCVSSREMLSSFKVGAGAAQTL